MYKRIRELRKDKLLTQREIADYLHCNQKTYSCYERGELDIPTNTLIKLAEFHNTTVDFLLGMTKRDVVFVDGLTVKQIETVKYIIAEFIAANNAKS